MKNPAKNRRMVALGVLIFVSFIVRLSTAYTEVAYPDSCLYLSFAKSILKGKFSFDFNKGKETILPPLYSIFNAIFTYIIGNIELSAILVSVIAGALLIIPVFYLTKAVYNDKAAWVSSILVILSPILIHWSGAMLTESLFITLFVSGIAAGLYAIENKKKIFFLISGALIGLSYMTRVLGLVAIPVIGIWIILYALMPDKSGNRNFRMVSRKIVAPLGIFALGFVLVTGIYLIRLHSFYGHWTLSGAYSSILSKVEAGGVSTMSQWENRKIEKAEESLYVQFIRKVTFNMREYSISLLFMLSLSVIFMVTGFSPRWKILYVASFIMGYLIALFIVPPTPFQDERIRYLSPILPLCLVIVSGGMIRIYEWIKWKHVKRASVPIMVGIVLLSFMLQLKTFPIQINKFWYRNGSVNFRKKVGVWMRDNLPAPVRVMSRKPYIPYYADAIWFGTPATYEEVIKLAHAEGVDYIVVDRGIEFYLRPELRFLFDTAKIPADLKFMGGIRDPRTHELYIGVYKISRSLS